MRIGALVPNSGRWPMELGIPRLAATLEAAGYESLWVADHIVLPSESSARYPFAADGRATWSMDVPYFDALVALALVAGATESAGIGTAVLVLPLRHPVELAKQAASIDVASGGRLSLGVGAGWLREEFEALGVPFAGRGERLEEWMALVRDCWTGRPQGSASDRYVLPPGMLCLPTPAHRIPFLIGGHSETALRRAGALADGWLAQQSLNELDPDELAAARRIMEAEATEAGREPGNHRVVLRIVDSAGRSDEVAAALTALTAAGVDEVIVNADWDGDAHADDVARLHAGIA